jgi:type II secretion system protein G
MKKMLIKTTNNSGFTLMELMIVIAILGILASLISGNFINSLKRGRDAKRKEDLHQIKNALEIYYEDNGQYPPDDKVNFGMAFTHPTMAAKVYMQKLPQDPSSGYTYQYSPTIENIAGVDKVVSYQLFSYIENDDDKSEGVNTEYGYSQTCCSPATCNCRLGITSPNSNLDGMIFYQYQGDGDGN